MTDQISRPNYLKYYYMCFAAKLPDEIGRKRFAERYGEEPQETFVRKGLLWVGPVPGQIQGAVDDRYVDRICLASDESIRVAFDYLRVRIDEINAKPFAKWPYWGRKDMNAIEPLFKLIAGAVPEEWLK